MGVGRGGSGEAMLLPQLVILFFLESMVQVLCLRENCWENLMQKPTKFPELATLRLRFTSRDISLMVRTRAGNDFWELWGLLVWGGRGEGGGGRGEGGGGRGGNVRREGGEGGRRKGGIAEGGRRGRQKERRDS